MIIQSTNEPIVLEFSDDISNCKELRVSLWFGNDLLKLWEKSDLEIQENIVIAKWTQELTAGFEEGSCILEIKWLTEDDRTEFAEKVPMFIDNRHDLEIMKGDVGDENN